MDQPIESFRFGGRVERSQKKEVGRPAYDLGRGKSGSKANKSPHRVYMLRFECGKALILDVPIPVAFLQVSSSSVARKAFISAS